MKKNSSSFQETQTNIKVYLPFHLRSLKIIEVYFIKSKGVLMITIQSKFQSVKINWNSLIIHIGWVNTIAIGYYPIQWKPMEEAPRECGAYTSCCKLGRVICQACYSLDLFEMSLWSITAHKQGNQALHWCDIRRGTTQQGLNIWLC